LATEEQPPSAGDGEDVAALEQLQPRWQLWVRREWQSAGSSHWLTRFLVLRVLGVVYAVAYLAAALQIVPLVGERGLTPAAVLWPRAVSYYGSSVAAFARMPSVFWFAHSDGLLRFAAWFGVALSLCVVAGYANAILLAVLWGLYLSFVHIGQIWYGYGWEILLCETGFLAIFLCPLVDARPFPRRPPPTPIIWLFRWLAVRVMLGAGLIKLRGDACWQDLTCLYYHYETQPLPNPLSRSFHFFPGLVHRIGVAYNHLVEVVAPLFSFGPRRARYVAGALMVLFQIILILSGNLSFLNYLTIVPLLSLFDDTLLARVLPARLVRAAEQARAHPDTRLSRTQQRAIAAVFALVAALSLFPLTNLLSGKQVMNTSFDPLSLVNTYGAFGSVNRVRYEIIFEGTTDANVDEKTRFVPYEFRCKPGDVLRRPCVVSPYQLRLDWQIWFSAMATVEDHPWTAYFVYKLLHADPGTLSLLERDPFGGKPPRFVRAELYRYEFAPKSDPSGAWWRRRRVGAWLPPLSADDPRLLLFLARRGFIERDNLAVSESEPDEVHGEGPPRPDDEHGD